MRVKKDKAYVVVDGDTDRVQGAFPFNKEGKVDARNYINKLSKKDKKKKFKIKIV